ncbi:MAG: DUF2780 domain-containing protein [Armatimonadota bacterium]
MHEFIESVTSKLGISQDQAQSATGSIMQMLKKQMNPQDYQQLEQKLPGSQEVAQQAPSSQEQGQMSSQSQTQAESQAQSQQQQTSAPGQSQEQSSGGGLGGMLGSLTGGAGGGMGNIMGMFTKSGLKGNQVNSFVSMFLDYVRQKAGGGMLDKILQQVPGLSSLAPMAGSTR